MFLPQEKSHDFGRAWATVQRRRHKSAVPERVFSQLRRRPRATLKLRQARKNMLERTCAKESAVDESVGV
jgi:hypothetical protein